MTQERDDSAQLIKRRFIAGAVCPECRAQDRLRVDYWRTASGEEQVQCCVACGFSRRDAADGESLPTLPRIRRGQQSPEVEAQPVRMLDPAKLSDPAAD
ncbi:MAG: YheV family putative metal-binding protein [Pseudomonadales bacterium]